MHAVTSRRRHQQPTLAAPGAFRLSLVLPAYNEEDTIAQAIQEAEDALVAFTAEYEIIVVDDGSSDHTAVLVETAAAVNPRVRLVQHVGNRGYGAALRTGFAAATLDLVACTDADCQFDLNELEYLLPLTRRYDIASGYRMDRQDSNSRRFFSWGYNTLVQLLIGSPVYDVDCAFKVFHRDQLPAILPDADNFFANTEMLTKARQHGLTVVEVGVHHRGRAAGQSKVRWRDVPRTLASLLPFWWSRTLFPAPPAKNKLAGWFGLGFIVLALIAGLLIFPNLSYPLLEPDEGRYAEIGREMFQTGNWIVPTLNFEPYYDKPPLLYWLIALSVQLFGAHEWAVRLVPTSAALATVLVVYFFGARMVGTRAAFIGALMLTLTAGFIQCARALIMDGLLSLWVTASLLMAFEAVRGTRLCWRWWLASAACCALGVLTKGPVAFVLLAPPVQAYCWLHRAPGRPGWRAWLAYAAMIACLSAPWYAAIIVRDREFAYQFIIDHHLRRFLTNEFHDEPLWFYVPVVIVGLLPWSLLLVPFARFLVSRLAAVRAVRTPALGFFLLWAGWCILFFSLSHGKLPTYVAPALPALALLLGSYLEAVLFRPALASFFGAARNRVPCLAVGLLCVGWLVIGVWTWGQRLVDSHSAHALIEAVLLIGCLLGILRWGHRLPALAAWGLCAGIGFAALFEMTSDIVPAWSAQRSPLVRSAAVRQLVGAGHTGVVCIGDDWGSIPFELNQDEKVVNARTRSAVELRDILLRHPRNLLIAKPDTDMQRAHHALQPGLQLTEVMASNRAKVFLVEAKNDQ